MPIILEAKTMKPHKSKFLKKGDIIFWVSKDKIDTAGHVAVINKTASNLNNMKIVHSTDHPLHNSFVSTHLPPSSKIAKHGKKYISFRIKNHFIRKNFIKQLNAWLCKDIPFSKSNELKMNKFDDSLKNFSTNEKILLQNFMFKLKKLDFKKAHKVLTTAMCTEVILTALHNAFLAQGSIPNSLYLIPELCPPSLMFFSIKNDQTNFIHIGNLEISSD